MCQEFIFLAVLIVEVKLTVDLYSHGQGYSFSGIYRDKTMADKLLVEMFEHSS